MAITVYQNDAKRNNALNLKVQGILKEISLYCENVDDARRYFKTRIREISTGNHAQAEDVFRILEVNNNFFEIWHYRPDGAQDWMMGSVKRKEA